MIVHKNKREFFYGCIQATPYSFIAFVAMLIIFPIMFGIAIHWIVGVVMFLGIIGIAYGTCSMLYRLY